AVFDVDVDEHEPLLVVTFPEGDPLDAAAVNDRRTAVRVAILKLVDVAEGDVVELGQRKLADRKRWFVGDHARSFRPGHLRALNGEVGGQDGRQGGVKLGDRLLKKVDVHLFDELTYLGRRLPAMLVLREDHASNGPRDRQ